jgi:two-component system sensor histidine kinase BaeS
MKINHKLTLAFLFVTLVAVGLAATIVWINTSIGFNQYIVDQRQADFISVVSDYYHINGNWSGVDAALRKQGLLPPEVAANTHPPDPQPFALVDQNRVVIIASGQYEAGQKIQKGVLEKGVSIESSGLLVGFVLTSGQAPVRNTIEQKYLDSVNRSLLVAALGGGLIALILGILFARSLTRPIRELTSAIRSMAKGDLKQTVPVKSTDELGALANSFNQLSADLSHSNQLRKQMAADIAHDLRNPITVISGYLESMKDGRLTPTPERFSILQDEVNHLQRLVEDLRILSLADSGELSLNLSPVSPFDLLERTGKSYQEIAFQKKIKFKTEVEPGLDGTSIVIDVERIEQVLGNLINNAIYNTDSGGEILLSARKENSLLLLEVKDNGTGISPDDLPLIFDRSFRGDTSRSSDGSGLGLAIAKSIVELHGGKIIAESILGEGSLFCVKLPGLEK